MKQSSPAALPKPSKLRLARRLAALLLWLSLLLPLHGLWRLLGRPSPFIRLFHAGATRALGVRAQVVGRALDNRVLFVANHVSWLDILALGGATGAAFVSKAEVAAWPLIGPLARIGGTIFVSRERRSAVLGQADALGRALASGRPAALFPEGTTGDGSALLPFRPSLLASLSAAADIRVQPVTIRYEDGHGDAARRLAWGDLPATSDMARIIGGERGLTATLIFHPPLDRAAITDRKQLAAAAQAAVASALPSAAGPRPL